MDQQPSIPSIRSPKRFETRQLALACFLIAGRHLRYLGLRIENGHGVFLFDDPDGRGPALEGDFDSGAECSASLYHATLKRLRREIDAALAKASGGR